MTPILAQSDNQTVAAALFYVFALMAGGSALMVVLSRNIVRMAVALLFTLIGVAGLYFLLGAEFLAAVQLVVYAGGTLILIIFGVMLTSKSPYSRFEPKLIEVTVALSAAVIVFGAMVLAILRWTDANPTAESGQTRAYPVDVLGQALLGDYLVPFELASVLLLVVMIGAAYLAKGRRDERRAGAPGDLSRQARQWS